jgi:predicted nucleic acid-binding protein
MSTEQPLALQLAEELEQFAYFHAREAATELRRQHARITELDEQMTGCIKLLKRTPKITRDIYVGKDRQAWGVQAKAVLDAAIAAQAKQGE